MISIRWLIIFSITLLVPSLAHACYWYPETEEYRYSAFNPLNIPTSAYRPFFFTTRFLNDYENKAGQENDRNRNIKEWNQYLQGQATDKDIYDLLYKTDPSTFAEVMSGKTPVTDSLKQNKFYRFMLQPKNKKLLEYITFSKQCELFTSQWNDPWEEDGMNEGEVNKLMERGTKNLMLPVDTFLHQRYAFQLVRLSFYANDYTTAVSTYEKEFAKTNSPSILKSWAMLYYANCLYRSERNGEAAYYYAKVFRESDEKKNAAFNFFELKQMKAALVMTKNDDEKADILSLASLERPERRLPLIIQVAQLSPNHPTIELLLTREINKCEDWLMAKEVNGFDPIHYDAKGYSDQYEGKHTNMLEPDRRYANELFTFLEKCTKDSRFQNQAFLNLAAAHMAFMLVNDSTGLRYISIAEKKQNKASEGVQLQIQLTKLMAEARLTKTIDAAFESRVANSIQWLQKHKQLADAPRMLQQFMAFLSSNYLHQGDVAKAALCRVQSRTYFDQPNLYPRYYDMQSDSDMVWVMRDYLCAKGTGQSASALLSLLDKKNKTPFEKILFNPIIHTNTRYILLDAAGTLYLQEDSLDNALRYFAAIPDTYWHNLKRNYYYNYDYLDANSFYAHVGNNHRCTDADSVAYNKTKFTQHLIALNKTATQTHDAKILVTIAHAYYNMTNYGNSWNLVSDFQSNAQMPEQPRFNQNYYGCDKAKEMYRNAFNTATDKETKAECCAMIAQCEKNHELWSASLKKHDYYFDWSDSKQTFTASTYIQKLTNDFADTKYYADLISQCGGKKEFMYAYKHFAY